MRLKRGLRLCAWALMAVQLTPATAIANSDFSIFLVRHAEKNTLEFPNTKNPPLTQCGQQRAKRLVTLLKDTDIEVVYSTDYLRTQQTAEPMAKQRGVTTTSYNPRNLKAFAKELKLKGQSALVVGHSNTTGELAMLLAKENVSNKEQFKIDESEFDKLFIVNQTDQTSTVIRLNQGFDCHKTKS